MKSLNAAVSILKIDPYLPGSKLGELPIDYVETDIHIDVKYMEMFVHSITQNYEGYVMNHNNGTCMSSKRKLNILEVVVLDLPELRRNFRIISQE